MTNLTLIWSVFRRHKARTVFTILSVMMAFAIFTFLAAINEAMTGQINYTLAQRIITVNKLMNGAALPVSYASRIESVPGVSLVAWSREFSAWYRKPDNRVAVLAFSPNVLKLYPEFKFPEVSARTAFPGDRRGAIIGPALARQMGWKVGETVPLQGGPPQKNGSTTWYFHIDGIYQAQLPVGYQSLFVTNYQYYNEGVADSRLKDSVYQFDTLIADPRRISRVAHAIDGRFASSSPQTMTFSEQQATLSGLREFGDIGAIISSIGMAVFFAMLLITGNTMANSVRERTGHFAMLRALGFSRWRLAGLVLFESLLLTGTGAALGLLLGWEICRLVSPSIVGILQAFSVTWSAVGLAAVLALAFALIGGAWPGRRVTTLSIAGALRRT
jgi:putative ABC transport system permease protein